MGLMYRKLFEISRPQVNNRIDENDIEQVNHILESSGLAVMQEALDRFVIIGNTSHPNMTFQTVKDAYYAAIQEIQLG